MAPSPPDAIVDDKKNLQPQKQEGTEEMGADENAAT